MGVFDGSTGMLEADPTPETYISMNKTKLLVADDDPFFQTLIGGLLTPDYDLVIVKDGNEAWRELQRDDGPRLAILDWVMPGFSGPQICRKVRASAVLSSTYLILLTARNNESDIVAGLRSGADDYITKPPIPAELRARIKMGERVLALQDAVKKSSTPPKPWVDLDEHIGASGESMCLRTDYQSTSQEAPCELFLTRAGDTREYSINLDNFMPRLTPHRRG